MNRRITKSVVLALSLGWACDEASTFGAEPPVPLVATTPAVAATPTKGTATKPAPKLDTEVVALLRRTALALESRSIESEEEPSFRALITAGDLLREDKTLAPSERERLRALVRVRLAQAGDVLKRQTAKQAAADAAASDGKAANGKRVVARNAVLRKPRTVDPPASTNLAQQLPGGVGFGAQGLGGQQGNGQANGTQASAEDLMQIITDSIKPESWDVNGGTGVIRYFSIGHALVIRATADTHGGIADLVGQLRN